MKTRFGKVLMLLALTPCICLSASVGDVSLNFSGVITDVNLTPLEYGPPPMLPPISVGDVLNWSITYSTFYANSDTSVPDLNPDPTVGFYAYPPYPDGGLYWYVNLTVTFANGTSLGNDGYYSQIQITHSTTDQFYSNCEVHSDGFLYLRLNNSTGTAFGSDALPASLIISEFDSGSFSIGVPSATGYFGDISGLVEVPEPSALALFDVGAGALALAFYRRLKSNNRQNRQQYCFAQTDY